MTGELNASDTPRAPISDELRDAIGKLRAADYSISVADAKRLLSNPEQAVGDLVVFPPGGSEREAVHLTDTAGVVQFARLECGGDLEAVPPASRSILQQVQWLQENGYPIRFFDTLPQDLHTLTTRTAILEAISQGRACLPLAESGRMRLTVESPETLEAAVGIVQGDSPEAPFIEALNATGAQWSATGLFSGPLNRLGLVESLRAGLLRVRIPRRYWFGYREIKVPDFPTLRNLAERYQT